MQRHHAFFWAGLLAAAALAGCYKVDLGGSEGSFLCPDDLCPSGFVCRTVGGQQRCVPEGQDLGVSPVPDGPAADAPPARKDARPDRGVRQDTAPPLKGCTAGAAVRVGSDIDGRVPFVADDDPKGRTLGVAWLTTASGGKIMVALKRGKGWDRPVQVASGAASVAASIDDGRILVAYRNSGTGQVQAVALKTDKLTGGRPRTLDSSDRNAGSELAFARDRSGRSVAVLVYRGSVKQGLLTVSGLKLMEVGRSSGGPGTSPVVVPAPLGAASYGTAPAALVDAGKVTYVAFFERRRGIDTGYLAVRKRSSFIPARPVSLGATFVPNTGRRIALAASGTRAALVMPAWDRTAFSGGGGVLQYRDASATSGTEVKPGGKRLPAPAAGPSLAFDTGGAQALAWIYYRTGEVGLTARVTTRAGWLAPVTLSDTRSGQRAEQVAILPAASSPAGARAFDLVYLRQDGAKRSLYHRTVTCRF